MTNSSIQARPKLVLGGGEDLLLEIRRALIEPLRNADDLLVEVNLLVVLVRPAQREEELFDRLRVMVNSEFSKAAFDLILRSCSSAIWMSMIIKNVRTVTLEFSLSCLVCVSRELPIEVANRVYLNHPANERTCS